MKRLPVFMFWVALTTWILITPGAARALEPMGNPGPVETGVQPQEDVAKALGLQFSGDICFRFEYFVQGQDYSPTHVSTPSAAFIDHDIRYRIRGRFGVEKPIGQEAVAGIRLATGDPNDPTNDFITLNSGTAFNGFLLDRVYIDWVPSLLDKKVSLTVGRIANPLAISPITWDEAVSPEGAAIVFEPTHDTKFTVFYFTAVQNGPSTTVEGAGADPFLANLQLQQKFKVSDADVALMAGYQYVSNTSAYETGDTGVTNYLAYPANPPGAPLSITYKGMVGDATNGNMIPEMHVLEGMLTVGHSLGDEKIPVLWTLHGALNLSSFNITAKTNANVAVNNPSLNDTNNLALFAQVLVGKVDHGGDWAGGFEWGYIDPNAVFAAYNGADSDIGIGHNNHTWFKGMVEAGLDNGLSLTLGQSLSWRANYDVFGTAPSNILDSTSRVPVLHTQIDLSARL